MKLLGIFIAAFVVIASTQEANAISLRFKFKVNSSGPNIYACNAGIRHESLNKKVCYFEGTQTACTPADCKDKTVCNTRCVCSGSNGGDSLQDYLKVTTFDWKDNGVADEKNSSTVTKRALYTGGWATTHADDAAWAKEIKELSFNLGSELYGAQYFVDICYRGPQIEYFADNVGANFSLLAQASATDFLATNPNPGDNSRAGLVIPGTVDGKKYSELAGLNVQAFYSCDVQGEGTYKYGHNGADAMNGTYNTTANEATFSLGSNLLPVSGGERFDFSPMSSLSADAIDLVNKYITGNGNNVNATDTHTPRFCKVRYVFTETNAKGSLPNFRKWQRHGAEVCTYTKIEESLGDL